MAEFVRVVFPIPNSEGYWYRNQAASIPKKTSKTKPKAPQLLAGIGFRVIAPLGRRNAVGFVVEESDVCPIDPGLLKTIIKIIDKETLFGANTVELARWVADMYFCSLGEALGTMLPTARRSAREVDPAVSESAGAEIAEFIIGDHALPLSDEQAAALSVIQSRESGTSYLYGATGTGKTEVFLQAAEQAMSEGKSVVYLVPEIALTGQVVRQAEKRFGNACAVIHSRLTPSQKLSEWRAILSGKARIVIGARSAIFAPVVNLGLIVIDEEHEGSYKSGNTPRYHARQVAMHRAQREMARLVLGSATPSVEAWHLCETGAMVRATLTKRPGGGAFPAMEIVDMRGESRIISGRLEEVLRQTKAEGRQSILFLNRRGFSYFFACNTCGAELTCRHCSVSLTYHKEIDQMLCHYCGYRTKPPTACPVCGSLDVGWRGFGTERVEEELTRLFPDWTIRRLDTDSTSRKGSLELTIEDFRTGRIDVLLGTQMVAKGLNFPGVKTIGVVLADTGLNLPDFRASERVFSLVVQVAGRAGRYDSGGRVIIQTFRPDNPVVRLSAALDLGSFHARELSIRQAQGFPPFSRLARIVFRSKNRDLCIQAARDAASQMETIPDSSVEILGPSECALGKVAGSTRWQILLRASSLGRLHEAIKQLTHGYKAPSSVHVEIDVDPVQLL
jgi:primosomal protein N' (replication factor Y)